jgi:hypothetical protein
LGDSYLFEDFLFAEYLFSRPLWTLITNLAKILVSKRNLLPDLGIQFNSEGSRLFLHTTQFLLKINQRVYVLKENTHGLQFQEKMDYWYKNSNVQYKSVQRVSQRNEGTQRLEQELNNSDGSKQFLK